MTIEIPLTRGLVALIDDADSAMIGHHKWRLVRRKRSQYAGRMVTTDEGKRVLILPEPGERAALQ